MAHIDLTRAHSATPERLREAVQRIAVDADLYGLFAQWKTPDLLLLQGKGVAARVVLEAEILTVSVTLPWLFRLVKGVIAEEVASKMQTAVAEAEQAPPEAA